MEGLWPTLRKGAISPMVKYLVRFFASLSFGNKKIEEINWAPVACLSHPGVKSRVKVRICSGVSHSSPWSDSIQNHPRGIRKRKEEEEEVKEERR